MDQHKNVGAECSNSSTNVTNQYQQALDTVDLTELRAAHQLAFEDLRTLVRLKDKALSNYSGNNKAWLESENKLLDAVADYVNFSEALLEQVDQIRQGQSDNLRKEFYGALSQFDELIQNKYGIQK